MRNIANINHIQNLLISSKKKLNHKQLKKFIYSNLEQRDIIFSKEDSIFVHYLKTCSSYEVFIITNNFDSLIFEVLTFYYENKKVSSVDLFLCDGFFALFINAKFYYFHKINSSLEEKDLKDFIYKKLNINIDRLINISSNELENLKKKFENSSIKNDFTNINIFENHSFKYFILFTLLCFIFTFLYLENEKNRLEIEHEEKNKSLKKKYEESKNLYIFKPLNLSYDSLNKFLKESEVKIVFLKLEKKALKLQISSKQKQNIYKFFSFYGKNISFESLVFDEKKKRYICDAKIKKFRK